MKTPRILVKAAPGLPSARLRFGAAAVTFTVTPLFKSIAPPKAPGVAAAATWQILTPPPGFGVAGVPAPEFAEPDLEQQWITGSDAELGMAMSRSCDSVNSQRDEFPHIADNPYWFRDHAHS